MVNVKYLHKFQKVRQIYLNDYKMFLDWDIMNEDTTLLIAVVIKEVIKQPFF